MQPGPDALDQLYEDLDLPRPSFVPIAADALPEPQRSLLDHPDDMTGTLEHAHGDRIRLRTLRRSNSGGVLLREVALLLEESGRPVEFGAIRIHLRRLPPAARRAVLEGKLPLGRILQDHRVEYESRPLGFFRVLADAEMRGALGLEGSPTLYGRWNRLMTSDKRLLAEVVEILPPGGADSR